jgi:DNA-binding transcriptional MerR regulator
MPVRPLTLTQREGLRFSSEVNDMAYKVGDVAKLAHVSVRTLHHYDETGLLVPSERSEAGYRLYTPEDLERLQQVLFHKELGFGLEEIRDLMADAAFDRREALIAQRDQIAMRALRLEAMLGLIDKTLASLEGGIPMKEEEMFEVFGDFDPSEHEEEVKERWGDTDAYKESARRTKGYSKEDWQRFKDENDAISATIASLMDEGVASDDPRAMDAVDRARLQIDTWFYPCSHKMHVGLGEMYIADPRFTANYEKIQVGMAQYVYDAIKANAARAKG